MPTLLTVAAATTLRTAASLVTTFIALAITALAVVLANLDPPAALVTALAGLGVLAAAVAMQRGGPRPRHLRH